MNDVMRLATQVIDILLSEEDDIPIVGFTLFNDCLGQSLSHAAAFTPTIMKKSIVLMQV